ncbi:MAG: HDIG domain-containing protein [Candidatus Colwellbacteria bacterium]|nr:HDIG domain-containing protein [Candidatus Colwellbacteria bacterium]
MDTQQLKKRALELLEEHIANKNLVKHNLAAGALMKALAARFGEGERADLWEIAGLLHDLDWEKMQSEPEKHTELTANILRGEGFPEEVVEAIWRHNFYADHAPPETPMQLALYYGEEVTGLVVASALVLPSRKLADLSVESVMKRFRQGAFARGVNRELLGKVPEKLGMPLEELAGIALRAMQGISEELGL